MAAKKIYKTANGRTIDFESLMLKNENVRAVGNMNVNARGDVIDNTNNATSSRSAQVNKNYRKQTGNIVRDTPVISSKKDIPAPDVIEGLDEIAEPAPVKKTKTKTTKKKAGGLGAAIAKVKDTKQEK